MTEGKKPILVRSAMAGLAIVAAAGGLLAPWNGGVETMVMVGVVGAVFAVVILPRARQLDRSVEALRDYAEAAARCVPTVAPRTPPWLQGTLDPLARAVETMRVRVESSVASDREEHMESLIARDESRIAKNALDGIPAGVLVTSAGAGTNGEVLLMNRAAAQILESDPVLALHRPLAEIGGPHLANAVASAQTPGPGARDEPVESRILVRPDGGRTCDVTLSHVRDARDEIRAVLSILRDRTAESRQADLDADLVAHVSHELRTPLSSLRSYVELLLDGEIVGDAARRQTYETMRDEAQRMGRLIDRVLKLSRIEAGNVEIDWQSVDIGALITRAARVVGPDAEAKRIIVETSVPECGLVTPGDPDMLYQVVLNLASNAVKYTADGGRVMMTARGEPITRSIEISVADTGRGIPLQEMPRLFEKFHRIKGQSRVADGSGLGLCLCKHIVERVHGGRIDVWSSPGVGSEFSFTIPDRTMRLRAAA